MIILTGKDGRPSMRAVFAEMKNHKVFLYCRRNILTKSGIRKIFYRFYTYSNSKKYSKIPIISKFLSNIIIRWGTRLSISDNVENPIVYNNIRSLENITNKKLTRQLLVKHNVRTPYYSDEIINESLNNNMIFDLQFPIIIRPLIHSKGKNFIVIKDLSELQDFYTENNIEDYYNAPFIDKESEFRVHCGLGKVLSILEKPKPKKSSMAWNRARTGEGFRYIPWSNYDYDLCKIALESIKAVKADFGAVDIIKLGNLYYVLEINSSPTLTSNDYTVKRYSQLFNYIETHTKDKKLEHWNFNKFKKAESLVWKNFQLNSEVNVINQEIEKEVETA